MSAIEKYFEFLWNCFQFDIQTFSHGWMYYYLLIPALGYFVFFILKWIVLTIPMWMPIATIMRFANRPSPKCRNCAHKTINEFESDECIASCNETESGKSKRKSQKLYEPPILRNIISQKQK